MPRGKNCHETEAVFVAQLLRHYPHRTAYFERGSKAPLSLGGEAIWMAFQETHCARATGGSTRGPIFCRKAMRFGRDYHQSFMQPDFGAENKGPSLQVFCLFSSV